MTKNLRILNLLRSLRPSETALLDWLEPRLDDSHLDEIAAADYGYEWEANFQALKCIHERQPLPIPLPWPPREVLELMRWSEPDAPQSLSPPPNSKGIRGHLIRAFCCAVLLKAADEPETRNYIDAENETLVQLLASVLALGRAASECALRFLCWRATRQSFDEGEAPFFALAVLLLYATLCKPQQDAATLSLLAEWVVAEEEYARVEAGTVIRSEEWLLGLTFHDQRHEVWRRLAQEVLLNPATSFPAPAATAMRSIVQRLVPSRS